MINALKLTGAFLGLALTATTVTAQITGNRNTFDNSVTLSVDTIAKAPLDYFLSADGYEGFRRMGFSEINILNTRQQAEEWFFERFGYDFTKLPADKNGVKMLGGIMEAPFHIDENTPYRAVMLKDGLKRNLDIEDAGISFVMLADGMMYHGTYGGEHGMEAMAMESVAYGFYGIPGAGANGATVLLKYHADGPMRMTMDGDMTIRCFIESEDFGNGYEMGLATTKMTTDGKYHVLLRNVITFPDSTVGDVDMPMMMEMMKAAPKAQSRR